MTDLDRLIARADAGVVAGRDGTGRSYTVDPIPVIDGDDVGVIETLERMLADAKKWPVLEVESDD